MEEPFAILSVHTSGYVLPTTNYGIDLGWFVTVRPEEAEVSMAFRVDRVLDVYDGSDDGVLDLLVHWFAFYGVTDHYTAKYRGIFLQKARSTNHGLIESLWIPFLFRLRN